MAGRLAGPAARRSCWRPSAARGSGPAPTTRASPAGTSSRPARPASAGSGPTPSICISRIPTTRRRRSTRPCAPSTTWCGRGRSATWDARTTRPGSSRWRLGISERHGWARYDCVQPRFNLLHRDIEADLLPLCRDQGVGVIAYNPLAGGFLTGKHSADAPPAPGTRFTMGASGELYRERYWHAAQFEAVEALKAFCRRRGWDLATASRRLGAPAARDHLGDRRGQPARAARCHPGRAGTDLRRRGPRGLRRRLVDHPAPAGGALRAATSSRPRAGASDLAPGQPGDGSERPFGQGIRRPRRRSGDTSRPAGRGSPGPWPPSPRATDAPRPRPRRGVR